MAFGAIIGGVASIAGSAIQANAAKDAAGELNSALDVQGTAERLGLSLEDVFGQRLVPPEFEFAGFDPDRAFALGERAAEFNASRGVKFANRTSNRINKVTLNNLERGMRRLFGGGGAFDRQRDLVNENTENLLEGNVSDSTQRLLSRRSIRAGASAIGPGAVDDQFTTYLGLTTEDNIQRGTENYRSMFATYRQAFPLTTGLDTLPFTSINPTAGLQAGVAGEQLNFQTALANYESQLNQALSVAAPDPVASGLLNAELQRQGATAGANFQANSAQGNVVATAGNQISGLIRGLPAATAPTAPPASSGGGGFNFGNFGGTVSTI